MGLFDLLKKTQEYPKERVVQNLIHKALGKSREATLAVFELVKNQPGY